MVMPKNRRAGKLGSFGAVILLGFMAIVGFGVAGFMLTGKGFFDLLNENRQLKEAIHNLTDESQIGYAKVVKQETREGKVYTKVLFVETDRADSLKRVLEKEFEIEGDIVHFDTLIVKFREPLVQDGKERAMYLWRRIYGETMRPEEGFPIETPGTEPQRYADICKALSIRDRNLFWEQIWRLSNEPKLLEKAGIQAIYGNVVYRQLQPGLIYVFKINNTGTLYPEVVPDL
jgi:hypothetical protein